MARFDKATLLKRGIILHGGSQYAPLPPAPAAPVRYGDTPPSPSAFAEIRHRQDAAAAAIAQLEQLVKAARR